MARRKKKKLTKKQKETIKRMKEVRGIDSNNLRDLILGKLKWIKKEIDKGKKHMKATQIQIYRLEGMQLFIQDLIEEPAEIDEEDKSEK